MAKTLPKHTLRKFVFQATYKPNLRFFDLLYTATQKLSGYEHWETNRLEAILHDYEKHALVLVQPAKFSYAWDYMGTKDYLADTQDILRILPTPLEIKNFKQLVLRKQFLIPTNMSFEEINRILNLKFLVQDKQLTDLFPNNAIDMSCVMVGLENELRCRVTLGPMKKKEISQHIEVSQKYSFDPNKPDDYATLLSSYPEVSVYIDLEVSRLDEKNGISIDYGFDFLEQANKLIDKKLSFLKNYIFIGE